MDLIGVREIRVARTRAELAFAPGERPLGGGTWLFSEPQDGLTGLVDLTGLGWEPIVETDDALAIAATCTIARLASLTPYHLRTSPLDGHHFDGQHSVKSAVPPVSAPGYAVPPSVPPMKGGMASFGEERAGGERAGEERRDAERPGGDTRALFWQCANSLLASFKVWNVATVGGNIALSLPAGPMTSLAVALDAELVIWSATAERRMPAAAFVTGVRENALGPDEVLRSIEIPRRSLGSRTGFRRIALSPLGRTGTLVIGRVDAGGEAVFTVTGGTSRPVQLRFDELPSALTLERAVLGIEEWHDDAHGAPDWRRAMSVLFAEELRIDLGGGR